MEITQKNGRQLKPPEKQPRIYSLINSTFYI